MFRLFTMRFLTRLISPSWSFRRFYCKLDNLDGPRSMEPNESEQTKRARLVYQSTKRGILENDLLLGGFCREHLNELTSSQVDTYDKLVNGGHNEWDIYYWITGAKTTPDDFDTDVMLLLRKYALDSRRHYYHKTEKV